MRKDIDAEREYFGVRSYSRILYRREEWLSK